MRNYVKKKPLSKAKQYRQKFSNKRNKHKVHYFRLRQTNTGALSSNGTGQINFAITVNDPSIVGNWTAVAALFDEVRVCAYKAVFTPYIPNQSGSTTVPAQFQTFAATSICFDRNDTNVSPGPSFGVNQLYENSRMKNLMMPWSYYVRIPKLNQYSTLAGTTPNVVDGYFRSDTLPNVGRVYINSIGLTPNQIYGSITHTFYIKARSVKG